MTTVQTCHVHGTFLKRIPRNTTWYSLLEYSMHMFELPEHVYTYMYMCSQSLYMYIYVESFVISYSSNLTFYIQ